MTDVQILTLALTLLGIFAASWFNNSRIGDIKDVFRSELRATQAENNLQFERINSKIDAILKMLADIDRPVTALEARKL